MLVSLLFSNCNVLRGRYEILVKGGGGIKKKKKENRVNIE